MEPILREIRDEIRQTNAQLDQTNARLDQTNARLDQTREELGRHIVDSEMRTATAITGLAGTLAEVKTLLADRHDLTNRVARCEHDIADLKQQ